MAKLVYSAIASLDGYVEDADGGFGWAAPDDEVHSFANELERSVGTNLYGRRMYDTMRFWETAHTLPDLTAVASEFAAIWQGNDKVVFSRTLTEPTTARTRIERDFDPDLVRKLRASRDRDLSIGGAELAGQAIRAGLVDELQLLLVPVLVGGGKPALPYDVRLDLELLDTRRFASGVVYLHYRVAPTP